MSIRGERQPVFGASNPADAQPVPGRNVSKGINIPQAHQPPYPGYSAGVNPGFDPRIVQYNSAPTVPQTSGQSGEPMPSGYNKDPRDKKRGKWVIGGVAAVAALGIAAGVVKVATEPSDKSTGSPSAGSGSSTSEVLYEQSCADALNKESVQTSVNLYDMRGSAESLSVYGGMQGVLDVHIDKFLVDDDGKTRVNVTSAMRDVVHRSLDNTLRGMAIKPGEVGPDGVVVGPSAIALAKVGQPDGNPRDGLLGADQSLCVFTGNKLASR